MSRMSENWMRRSQTGLQIEFVGSMEQVLKLALVEKK